MNGTVKQFKDTLEEMRSVYPFKDENTYMRTDNMISCEHNFLRLATVDERTGIEITMSKSVTEKN